MNGLLRPRIWPSFRASSGLELCDVLFKYASGSSPCDSPVARPPRLSEQARDGGQARPSNSRSLRSAQSRKRVPSFTVSRQQFMKYPG